MKKRGFTLIEMLIVIIIIGILAATLIPRIGNARDKANDTAKVADVRSIATAVVAYGLEHGSYPASVAAVSGANYGLTTVPTPPDSTTYSYNISSANDHFAVCAQMSSSTSTQGNSASDIAGSQITYSSAITDAGQSSGAYYCYVG